VPVGIRTFARGLGFGVTQQDKRSRGHGASLPD
jgi:hypothetical protein